MIRRLFPSESPRCVSSVLPCFKDNKGLDCCHPDEVREFAYMCDMKHVKALIEAGARSIVRNFRFRLRLGEDYEWVSMDIEAEKEPCGWRWQGWS